MLKSIKDQFKKGNYLKCIEMVYRVTDVSMAEGSQENEARSNLKIIQGNAFFALKRYSEALDAYREVFPIAKFDQRGIPFTKIRTCIDKQSSDETSASVLWESFSDEICNMFDASYSALIEGNIAYAYKSYTSAVGNLPVSEKASEKLLEAYRAILGSNRSTPEEASQDDLPADGIHKIIVSGMGWSGSGALFDYFKEFSNVVAIHGEAPYIELRGGVITLGNLLESRAEFKREAYRFFFYALVGAAKPRRSVDFKFLLNGRKRLKQDDVDYVEKIIKISTLLASVIESELPDQRLRRFNQFCEAIVDLLVVGDSITREDQVALLDNVIHIGNIDAVRYISNASVFCTFRDPRSNYVALLREAAHYQKTVNDFIADYRSAAITGHALISRNGGLELLPNGVFVKAVQFERFVVSQEFRDLLKDRVPSDLGEHNQFAYFRPWDSFKNAVLHTTYEVPSEIAQIQEKLRQFCVKIDVLDGVA